VHDDTHHALHIDWTACDGRGTCAELVPELLDRDPWGYPMARPGVRLSDIGTEADIGPDLTAHLRRAVDYCPLLALRLSGKP
jgi:ferredoxin